ncbi:MAG: hypothetical protein HZB39_13795 [Planctomycetes bacterium]|nr:hypothetical protein [Planctomycetota bacterium]
MHGTSLARVLVLLLSASALSAQRDPSPPRLIRDLDTRPLPPLSSAPEKFAAEGALLWFAADDGVHGKELFRSLGTPQSTVLVADLQPGVLGSYPRQITPFARGVFFLADDGGRGHEPHCSDGTSGGTMMLRDFAYGSASSIVTRAFAFGSSIVFFVEDGVHGSEPWVSDGTVAGTRMIADIEPGRPGSSFWGHVAREVDGRACIEFAATSGGTTGLWRSDGTTAGTRLVTVLGARVGTSALAVLPDGRSVFWTGASGVNSLSAWASDGTAAGSAPFATVTARIPFAQPFVFDGRAFFPAYDAPAIATDGTPAGTRVISSAQSGTQPFQQFLGVANGELWSWVAGGQLVRFSPGQWIAGPVNLPNRIGPILGDGGSPIAIVGHRIVYWEHLGELRSFDPVTSTSTSLGTSAGRAPLDLVSTQGRAYFPYSDPTVGVELGASDGTPTGTQLIVNVARDDSRANTSSDTRGYTTRANGALFEQHSNSTSTLWRSDGTPHGTTTAHTSSGGAFAEYFAEQGVDYLVEWAYSHRQRLLRSQGASTFTEVFVPGPPSMERYFRSRATLGDAFFVAVHSWTAGASGVMRVDVSGATSWVTNYPSHQVVRLGERLLVVTPSFIVTSPDRYRQMRGLLLSDGTSAGTTMLGKFEQSVSACYLPFVVFRDRAWFLALDGDGSEQLASTDSRAGGLAFHAMLRPGVSDNGVLAIAALDDAIVLVDETTAWICDGITAPRAVPFRANRGWSTTSIYAMGNRVLIVWPGDQGHTVVAVDAARGTAEPLAVPNFGGEPPCILGRDRALLRVRNQGPLGPSSYVNWITDGSAAGTRPLAMPGFWSTPVLSRGRIFAPAFDPVAGVEPHWSDPGATVTRIDEGCGATRSPGLDALADPILGSTVPLRGHSRAGAIAFLLLSPAPLSPPPLLGGTPCRFQVDPAAFAIQGSHALANGEFRTTLSIPADPALRGYEVVLQFVAGPTNATLGADLSNGLLLTLGY